MMRGRRIAVLAVVLLILLPLAGSALLLASIDPAAVKARIAAEVQRATGRGLAVGALRLRLLPDLVVDADDVTLANPPGFSRASIITARHVQARIALLPLLGHSVVIRQIVLTGADLKLERLPGGAVNWRLPKVPPDSAPHAPGWRFPGLRLDTLTVLGVSVSDASLAWAIPDAQGSGGQGGMGQGSMGLARLELHEVNASSTIHFAASVVLAGDPVELSGRLGGQAHLWNKADRSDWPVDIALNSAAGSLSLTGSIRQPLRLAGYDLSLQAHGPDLGRLTQSWPSLNIPRLRDLALATRLIDRADGIDVPRLSLTAGSSDLGAGIPGLTLDRLEVNAPNIDGTDGIQTNHVSAAGGYAGQRLQLDATLGPVGRLFGRRLVAIGPRLAEPPIVLDASVMAAGASLILHGNVAPFGDWAGTDAALQASIPNLSALSPLLGRGLPRLRDVALSATVSSAGGVLSLRGAHLATEAADISADGTARLGGRPNYRGTIAVARLDLDALRNERLPAMPAPAAPPITAQIQPQAATWILPDRPLGLELLSQADADIRFSFAHLVSHGVAIEGGAAHLVLDRGRLTIDPASGRLAGTAVSGSLLVDAGQMPPVLALDVRAPGTDLAAVLAAFGAAGDAGGRMDLDAALTGTGATAHAIAGTLTGRVGLAVVNGTIDNRLLTRALAFLVPAARIGVKLPLSGTSAIACLATRLDLHQGVAAPRAFLLDTSKLRLSAAGAIDLRRETFALRLRPYVVLGPIGLVLPSRVDGAWREPHMTLEPASGAASAASMAAAIVTGRQSDDSLSAVLAGVAGSADALLGQSDSGDCSQALAIARDTSDSIQAAPPSVPAAVPTRRQRAIDLLRRLFKRPS